MNLLFIYNADSGHLNALFDMAHKIIRPESYSCDLCSLTHGAFSEKKAWRDFREHTRHHIRFLHKDEFEKEFDQRFPYPSILEEDNGKLTERFSRDDIAAMKDIQQLIQHLKIIT